MKAAWFLFGSRAGTPVTAMMSLAGGALLGWRLPDAVLLRLGRRRRLAISRGLPDALDLLVICGEAGLGLETAMERVAREMRYACPPLGEELTVTAAEMRVRPDRYETLAAMAERLDLDVLRSVVATLSQSMRYGTPLGQAMRVLANEMRTERMIDFERRAARLPVLITLPMIGLVLPCVILVAAGPALLDVIQMLSNR
jgi:tight adherence protein C